MECALSDLNQSNARDRDRRRRMEAEANRFAAHLLMPTKRIRDYIRRSGISLETIVAAARDFEVSKEALARAFVNAWSEPVAVLLSRDGRVVRFYRHEDFPFLPLSTNEQMPPESFGSQSLTPGHYTEIEEVEPDAWLSEREAARALTLTEQALGQRDGHAITLLQVELDEDE